MGAIKIKIYRGYHNPVPLLREVYAIKQISFLFKGSSLQT